MGKVGVLIFTDKAKERVSKNDFYDGKKNFGINKVLKNADFKYEYCSTFTMHEYTDILISLTSYYDILNLVRAIPVVRSFKVHVGGPGVNNIRGYMDYIDSAWFGRCDFGEVNGIINGFDHSSFWKKVKDPVFENNYTVCESTEKGLGYDGEEETSVGCKQKCSFCHYSWWNNYTCKNEESYKSGYTHYEDFFQAVNWSRGRIITALDGMTEETRKKISKPITYEKIKEKLLETNLVKNREKNITAKIYSIIGYPWEEKRELEKCDITRAFKEIDGELKNPILFYFHLSHFVPMQKTPMWYLPFNFNNYWIYARDNPVMYESENIKLYTGTSTTSPASAAEETIIQRANNDDCKIIKILASKKWRAQKTEQKISILKKELSRFFVHQENETIANIKTPWNYLNKTF